MKNIKLFILTLVILMISSGLYAGKEKFKFAKINLSYQTVSSEKTEVSGLSQSNLKVLGKTRNWGMIEAYYNSGPNWADNVEVRYYVLMKNRKEKQPVMLEGAVTYMNIGKGKNHLTTMFIPPQAVTRYGQVGNIRAELWHNGVQESVIFLSRKESKTEWWTKLKPVKGTLLNRYYTPFKNYIQSIGEDIKGD